MRPSVGLLRSSEVLFSPSTASTTTVTIYTTQRGVSRYGLLSRPTQVIFFPDGGVRGFWETKDPGRTERRDDGPTGPILRHA